MDRVFVLITTIFCYIHCIVFIGLAITWKICALVFSFLIPFISVAGSDAILLGAETLRGLYPIETISTVGKICAEVIFFKTAIISWLNSGCKLQFKK